MRLDVGEISMDADLALSTLLQLGLRITSSRDMDAARWLVAAAGADAVGHAAYALASRRAPRPQKVIAYLGLDRRRLPRPDLPQGNAARIHARNRLRGRFGQAPSENR